MSKRTAIVAEQQLSLEERRAFLKLPMEERRRLMDQQAARVVRYYRTKRATAEREAWQGGDIVETS